MSDRVGNSGDGSITDRESWEFFINGPREIFTCEFCGKNADRRHPPDGLGALYAEVDNEPAIICTECDDAHDWETIADRIRSHRRTGKRSPLGESLDRVRVVLRSILSSLPGPLSAVGVEQERHASLDTGHQFEQTREGDQEEREGGDQAMSPPYREEKLEQTREWASYLASELQDREEQVEDLEAELATVKQQLRDARQTEPETAETATRSRDDLLQDLFDIRDSFRRALDAEVAFGEEGTGGIQESVEMIDRQIRAVLEREGIEELDTSGNADPTKHKVVQTVESDSHDPGEIVEVSQLGYRRGEEILREAHVVVAEDSAERGADENRDTGAGGGSADDDRGANPDNGSESP